MYLGKVYEEISKTNTPTENKYYISAGGQTFAVRTVKGSSEQTHYLHRDHLGSIDTLTNENGQGLSKFSFSAFGSRRGADNWNSIAGSPISLASVNTTRGFTGHEQLDEVGLVHMNGRVYDPQLGRFLSADPQVQYTSNLQNYNRYTYVNNNPLSFTDPSGFSLFGFKGIRKAIKKAWENPWVRLAVGIAVAYFTAGAVNGFLLANTWGNATIAAIGSGFAGGFALGGITTGSLKGALIGGVQGAAFGFVGSGTGLFKTAREFAGGLGKFGLRGAVGGTFSRVNGGSFKDGFVSSAVTSFANSSNDFGSKVFGTVRAAVAGGLAAKLTGGKFENGAKTAAFARLFSDIVESRRTATSRKFENFMKRLSGMKELDRGPFDPFNPQNLKGSINDIPDSVRNYKPDSLFARLSVNRGNHDFNVRLPGGYHITTDSNSIGVNVHRDYFNPMNGVPELIGHGVEVVADLYD